MENLNSTPKVTANHSARTLTIRKNGSKFFRLDFRYGGKRLSMSLGVYPQTSLK